MLGFIKNANYDETSTAKFSNNVCECASENNKVVDVYQLLLQHTI